MPGFKIRGGKVGTLKKLKAGLKRSGGGANWLVRVPQEGSIVIRFLEEPEEWIEFQEFWSESDKAFYPVSEDGPQPEAGQRPSRRYLVNAVDTNDNKVIALVLPLKLAKRVVVKYEKYKTLLDRNYEITREGTGFDTDYEVDAETPTRMNLDRFEPLDLLDLLEKQFPQSDDDDDEEEEEEAPRRSTSRGNDRRPVARRPVRHDEDDEEDDDEPPARRRTPSKTVTKKTAAPVKKPLRRR